MIKLYNTAMNRSNPKTYILTITCPARSGIVATVFSYLYEKECYINEISQYDDEATHRFFCRIEFRVNDENTSKINKIRNRFIQVSQSFKMEWLICDKNKAMRVLIMASKEDHCLTDLLYRKNKGELAMEITAVVSNHINLRPIVEREGIPFVYLPIRKNNKEEQEDRLLEVVSETHTELVVLARYMQILSNRVCDVLKGKCINIHHSFLPGFKGARPYHQAYERGVKLIGATAHYVTNDLDEGQIIEQVVERVDHTQQPTELASLGKYVENRTLAKAVSYHIQRRVFVDQVKTVILR